MRNTPGLFWLDASERAQRLARDAIEELRTREARDELGLGTVRDAIADALSPGTSTVMTRARYYLFVPWMYRAIERKPLRHADDVARALRRSERDLLGALVDVVPAGEGLGVIGARSLASRGLPQRLPSEIYWAGLGVWGIRRSKVSLGRYHRDLALGAYHEGEGTESDGPRTIWDSSLRESKSAAEEARRSGLGLSLQEAQYLRERIAELSTTAGIAGRDTLLLRLIELPAALFDGLRDDPDAAWTEASSSGSPVLAASVDRARWLSTLLNGAQLLYNELIERDLVRVAPKRAAELKLDGGVYRSRLRQWHANLRESDDPLFRKEPKWFWDWGPLKATRADTCKFVNSWVGLGLTGAKPNWPQASSLVERRERDLKGHRSRLGGIDNEQLRLFQGAAGAGALDYRWGITLRIVEDIRSGLGRET